MKGGAGPIAAVRIGMPLPWPEKNALAVSDDLSGMLAVPLQFLRRRLGAGRRESACFVGGWGQENQMIWGSVFEKVVGKRKS